MKKYIAVLLSLLSSLAFAQESFVKKDFNVAVNVKLICIEDYDSDGNCVHRISANGVECWYEYDSHGNWIPKKSNVSGNSSDESLCEYEYDDKDSWIKVYIYEGNDKTPLKIISFPVSSGN